LKIAIVNTFDLQGGAARAAFRLHEALLAAGHDCRMFVLRKTGDHDTVYGPRSPWAKVRGMVHPHLDGLPKRVYRHRTKTPFSVAWLGTREWLRAVKDFDPDVVHLHWINGGFVRPEQLRRLDTPIVWSLHDMWAFTGGCHYTDAGCTHYTVKCGACPVLGSNRVRDISRRIWNRKSRTYRQIGNLTVVGPSRWLATEAKRSGLFDKRNVVNLPNPINTQAFRPIDRRVARDLWGLPQDKRVVLFGAVSATADSRKGYDLLLSALVMIQVSAVQLCVFGASSGDTDGFAGLPVRYVGHLHDDVALITLYSAADVMVVPSRTEAFGQTASEAMSCGTPVVAFGMTGLLDIVDHQKNGYLAEPFEPADLAAGIQWVLDAQDAGASLAEAAREKVVECFDYPVVAERYTELYESITEGMTSG
jgi:glycosyltransferase involved in cell wall biosynthesis